LIRFFFGLLFVSIFHCVPAMSADVRAQWIDAEHVKLQLPLGLYVHAGTEFYLIEDAQALINSSALSLPLINVTQTTAILSSAHLTAAEIDRALMSTSKIVTTNAQKQIIDSTAIQFSGILDTLYFYGGDDLGGNCTNAGCNAKLWAPTAQKVRLFLFEHMNSAPVIKDAIRSAQGVWAVTLPATFKNYFYQYEVTVYHPQIDKVITSLVTDPYSKSLALNGARSQLVDVLAPETKPVGWDRLQKPELASLNDSVIYELHIRDFSAHDDSVPLERQGSYLAFTETNSRGMRYLKSLAQAGLTHLHLLPFNDFGSVNEDKIAWENYTSSPSNDLKEPQSVLGGLRALDPFNWGYDPVHYLAPEGSYAVQGEGWTRLREVRAMVQGINASGLRVVQDVVFNHTYQSGLEPYSIFDKIVPLYYYRLNTLGQVERSSCCNDTASEVRMMEKLMIDSVLFWAKNYKLDGFRFDLMSFHSKESMFRLRQALRSLTLAKDGVDGSKILLYGEGWSFGSFFERFPQEAMSLENSYATEYGFFNDRIRDAVRGGTTNSWEKSDQGFATGLFFDFNFEPANRNTPPDVWAQRDKLLHLGDVIKSGLAGNMRDFIFREHLGAKIKAGDLFYRGSPVAVAAQPLETINYVVAHDGYSLWDAIQAKLPFHTPFRTPQTASTDERQRVAQLSIAIPLLGQGLPFIEGGTELLRSKNGDQDSYDSGDFFNRIDWSANTNYWGEALPPSWKNINEWPFWLPRLQDPSLQPSPAQIQATSKYFKGLLRVRKSSSLFRMKSLSEVSQNLQFIDDEPYPEPGLIGMYLHDSGQAILVFFNSSKNPRAFVHPLLAQAWKLHPDFDSKIDSVLSGVVLSQEKTSIQIPGRTTVVLVSGGLR
jgi:pullulanase